MSGARVDVRDTSIAVAVAAIMVTAALAGNRPPSDSDQLGLALLAAGGLALAARRRAPIAVLAVTGLCAIGYQAAGFTVFATAYLVAVYSAMRAGHRAATAVTSLIVLAALPVTALLSRGIGPHEAFDQARDVLELAWLVAAAAAGEALRQAERRADEAERTREEGALRRADEERLRIARELHDSLTHQISVIKIQAEAAVHVARKRGEPVPEALLVIRDAGREAARELRVTLEALREDDKAPPCGLDDLAGLVQRATATGLHTSLTIEGEPAEVPAAVDRTAYRIVQESLTNVARHARAGTATVRVAYHPDTVVIQVDDDGTATRTHPPAPGIGLLGMRERVTALGGRLRAEPRHEGGFTVHAELPVDRTS
jgi:signal transduction histidine kinase